jgi:type III restriction enzyme
MELRDFQRTSLERIRKYLKLIRKEQDGRNVRHASEDAWRDLEKEFDLGQYISRRNGLEYDVPNFVMKIPTGGGKTFLAIKTIDVINEVYKKKRTGLVLWVVPTTSIYRQTVRALKDRNHPYRQHLDIASGGRTLILEKFQGKIDRFHPIDIEENLVVYVLMLQSAARNELVQKDLRIFADSGGFQEFFPPEDRLDQHEELIKTYLNLETFNEAGGIWKRQIKTSLGNVLRLLNPSVILDESQKAYSPNAQRTIYGFNPSIVIELSATPPQASNILVNISGRQVNDEQMIKLDMHITRKSSLDWKDTLWTSVRKREELEKEALRNEQSTGIYIRPICLVRTERVGKEQQGKGYIHSNDVRDELIRGGIPAEYIAIKTSEEDELKNVDDIGGLLSRDCSIRYIITKQALQEGWDCAFAYVLAVLDKTKSKTALTQLVGRILRQPYAKKTGRQLLDESYVFVYRQEASELLEGIKKGFEREGLGDLRSHISTEEGLQGYRKDFEGKEYSVRKRFEKVAGQIILPFFTISDRGRWRKVNYEMDILSIIDWNKIDLKEIYSLSLTDRHLRDDEYVAQLSDDVKKVIKEKRVAQKDVGPVTIDTIFMTQQLCDIVPNPWIAYQLAEQIIVKLVSIHGELKISENFSFIIEESKRQISQQRDALAEVIFNDLLEQGVIRFMVVGENLGYKLPKKIRIPANTEYLRRPDGDPMQLSLFEFVAKESFTHELEKPVAYFLDDQTRLFFWYRNESKLDYSIQAWKKDRIYPDFIFTITDEKQKDEVRKVYVVETKGVMLAGNPDTKYKESVFQVCNRLAKKISHHELSLTMQEKEIEFEVIYGQEWERRLNELFSHL